MGYDAPLVLEARGPIPALTPRGDHCAGVGPGASAGSLNIIWVKEI
jgi:hypothetical protein